MILQTYKLVFIIMRINTKYRQCCRRNKIERHWLFTDSISSWQIRQHITLNKLFPAGMSPPLSRQFRGRRGIMADACESTRHVNWYSCGEPHEADRNMFWKYLRHDFICFFISASRQLDISTIALRSPAWHYTIGMALILNIRVPTDLLHNKARNGPTPQSHIVKSRLSSKIWEPRFRNVVAFCARVISILSRHSYKGLKRTVSEIAIFSKWSLCVEIEQICVLLIAVIL